MVYWHHFNETEEMDREVEAFPSVVFGVALAILENWRSSSVRHCLND